MIKILTSNLNALRKTSHYSSFKTRKMIAQGIIMSYLCYLVQLYGSSSEYLLSLLQTLRNAAARSVTRLPWNRPTSTLLLQCGWLTVRQMVDFYSLVLLYKIKMKAKPTYLYEKVSLNFGYRMRLATTGGIPEHNLLSTDIAKSSFINRTVKLWNNMPTCLGNTGTEVRFKKTLKSCINPQTD